MGFINNLKAKAQEKTLEALANNPEAAIAVLGAVGSLQQKFAEANEDGTVDSVKDAASQVKSAIKSTLKGFGRK